ncbi:MAG: N-acetylmuramoyl-L-alanine amidase, partial [Oscillospiraceae bacterium]|nr:N-acetylmuramoyl-L-alanine amidase [Oscillospiraceae bacterium]
AGNTDPNPDATINGVEINPDENGYFQLEMDLKEGDNVFNIYHKGKTVTYNITHITEVVKEVSPGSGTLKVDGATKITIDAVAYNQAKVYAVIGGKTVLLKQSEEQADDEYRDTNYAHFIGVYTVPDAEAEDVDLGYINVCGEWNGITRNKYGAKLVVNKRRLPSDGTPIVVTSELGETFRGDTVSQYSEPTYFPLPKGALDYAIGDSFKYNFTYKNELRTYDFYRLQSGLRVFTEDIAPVSASSAAVDNAITGCTVTSDSRYTKVILKTKQQVAYTGQYAQDKLTFKFHYTNSMPESMKLDKNPLFSAVEFTNDTMTLVLKQQGKLLGMYPYFDNDGNLVLRFNNPPKAGGRDLSGVRIVIDPGHGGNDPGALGFLASTPEKVINYSIASKLATTLRNRGATVTMLNTQYNNYSLEQRVAMTAEADPHMFISVHCNSSGYNSAAKGTEAYYFNYWSSGLAQFVSANVAQALGTENRGQKHGYYAVTRSMQYPAILLETGFMSNQSEYHKLANSTYQSNIASAIANGIGQYFTYMSTSAGLTGTQSSGAAAADTGQNSSADQNLSDNGVTSATGSNDAGTLKLDVADITIQVGEEAKVSAEWSGADAEIVWEATGEEGVAELGADGKTLHIKGTAKGELKLTASVSGQSGVKAECTLTVK